MRVWGFIPHFITEWDLAPESGPQGLCYDALAWLFGSHLTLARISTSVNPSTFLTCTGTEAAPPTAALAAGSLDLSAGTDIYPCQIHLVHSSDKHLFSAYAVPGAGTETRDTSPALKKLSLTSILSVATSC